MPRHAVSEPELERALRRGLERARTEFRARAVHYWPEHDAVAILTERDGGFLVPRTAIEPLRDVDPGALARIEIWAGGSAFAIADRDIHVSVHGLLTRVLPGLIPPDVLATLFARRGGTATSPAKRASARENGRKGGRPRKLAAEPA